MRPCIGRPDRRLTIWLSIWSPIFCNVCTCEYVCTYVGKYVCMYVCTSPRFATHPEQPLCLYVCPPDEPPSNTVRTQQNPEGSADERRSGRLAHAGLDVCSDEEPWEVWHAVFSMWCSEAVQLARSRGYQNRNMVMPRCREHAA